MPLRFLPIAEVPRGTLARQQGERAIYALVDPRDTTVRYVGVTSSDLSVRLTQHLRRPTNSRTRQWFEELSAVGLQPEIHLLSAVQPDRWPLDRKAVDGVDT